MSSIDVRKPERKTRSLIGAARHHPVDPVRDILGVSLFLFHLCVCAYILGGWLIPSASALVFYLVFLPMVAMQWLVNHGSCVLSKFETLLRARRWRDPEAEREGRVISATARSIFGFEARTSTVDGLRFGAVFVLWILGFVHLAMLGDPALLSIFP